MELTVTPIETFRLLPDTHPATLDATRRTVDVVAYSGARVSRIDPYSGTIYDLRLSLDQGHVRLGRLEGAPVLDSHGDASIRNQIGVVERAWVQDGRLLARLRFSDRADVEPIWNDIRTGIVRNISIGALVYKREKQQDGSFVATDWEPMEISVVPVPADAQATVLSLGGKKGMTSDNQVAFDARAAATEIAARLKLGSDFVERAASARDVDEVRRLAFDTLADEYDRTPTRSHVAFVRDEGDIRREALTAALLHRITGGELPEHARQYAFTRLPDAARECLRWRGERLAGMSDSRVVQLAMSTSDFPQVLANVANKTLLDSYQAAPAVLRQICRQTTAADFRERRVLRFGEGTGLQFKAEGAEYTYGSIAEQTSSYSVKTFGKIFAFSREMIVNDDLGALDQFFRAAGRLAVEFEARMLADLLTANSGAGPVLSDGLTLFHTNHGNVASSGGAISVQTLDTARAALRRQKGLDGAVIVDSDPRFLIVPVARQTAAEQVTASITPAQTSNVNPFAGRLAVLADPHLDDASTTAWYVAADPTNVPVFEFAYLEGAQGPQTEQETDFDRDVLKFKIRLDVGAGVVDWRGIYKNPGA